MPDFAVATTFFGKDKVSEVFKGMGKNADKFGKDATRSFRRASQSASRFGDITKGILTAGIINKALGGLRRGVGSVTQEFIKFDDAIISASAKFKGLNFTTAKGRETLLKLKKTAREVGSETQFSAGAAASGLDFLALAGFNAEQAMASLRGVVDLATVAGIDLASATDIASDSLGAFGLMTKDSNQLQKNFTRLNDVMALTMSRTNTNLEDMFEAIKKGAPTFTSAGQSLESFNALLGVMANSGVKGSEAGTILRNVMLRLAKPTKEAKDVLSSLSIQTNDAKGNFRDVIDILADFEKGLKGMGTQQRAAALSTVFGARAITGVNLLLAEGADSLINFRKEILNSAGASEKMASIMRQSLGNRLKALSSSAIELGFKFFTAFEKQGVGAINKLTDAIRSFDPAPIINGLKIAFKITKALFGAIEPFLPLMPVLIGMWIAYGAALKAVAIVSAISGFIQFVGILRQTTSVMGILNAVMLANPVGVIVAGVGLLIGATILLTKHWDKVTAAISGGVGKIKSFFGFGKTDAIKKEVAVDFNGQNNVAPNPEIIPSNREEIAARKSQFSGMLKIAGAPQGSTFEDKSGAPSPINVEMLGQN